MDTRTPGPEEGALPRATTGPVFLLGMMGAGKTTVGRVLAGSLRAELIDLDVRVERMSGRSVARVFEEEGEEGFRAWERRALRSLLLEPGFADRAVVVATGGGVVTDSRNVDDMLSAGTTVFIDPPLDVLVTRLWSTTERAHRPKLAADGESGLRRRLERLLLDRRPEYERARVIDPGEGSPLEVAERIVRRLSPRAAD